MLTGLHKRQETQVVLENMKTTLEKTSAPCASHQLAFNDKGVCTIILEGLPQPTEIEGLIEEYVTRVELLPYPLKVILLDISRLAHMQALTRQVFSEFLIQASNHYGDKVQLLIAGGPYMIRKYTEIFCKALKFGDRFHSLEKLEQAQSWLKDNIEQAESARGVESS